MRSQRQQSGVLIQLISEPLHAHSPQPLALAGVAWALAKQDDQVRALELLALVVNHRFSWQMARDQAALLIAELEAELPPDVAAAAWECGKARDLEATVAELLDELDETFVRPPRSARPRRSRNRPAHAVMW